MKKINIILALSALAVALVSCVDEPVVRPFPADKYYYDIPNMPVDQDYVVGVMYNELTESYWFKGLANNAIDYNQPQLYTGTPILGDSAKNGGYYINKDYYNGGVILRQQLDWAKRAGIDFLLVNWDKGVAWNLPTKTDTIMLNFKNVWKPGDPKIAFVFSCGHLFNAKNGSTDSLHTNYFSQGLNMYIGTYQDGRGTKQTFLDQLDSLKYFFNEEFYYKLSDGRPLLGLDNYTRTNSVSNTVNDVRNAVKNAIGSEVYLISPTITRGDGFTNIDYIYNIKNTVSIKGTGGNKGYSKDIYLFRENGEINGTPQMPFDAMYEPGMLTSDYVQHGEDNWKRNFFCIINDNYRYWKQKMEAQGKDFIPSVMPGFDNRANVPTSTIYLQPRDTIAGDLYQTYASVGKLNANSARRIIFINSWNNFKQGNGLEPTKEYGESYLDFTKKYFKKD